MTWAVISSIAATVEYVLNRSILGREQEMLSFARDGQIRAIVASEQPLVLGTVLAACIPLVMYCRLGKPRLTAAVLMIGSYSTGSRAPTALAALFFLLQFVPGAVHFARQRYRAARFAWITTLLGLMSFSFFVWTPVIAGSSGMGFSTQYRTAMYSLLPNILQEAPFGYGFGPIPTGRWLMSAKLYGVVDLAVTVDSELVYSALGFGFLGVGAFAIATYIGVAAMRYDYAISASCTVISVAGLILALHAWDSVGPFWYLLIGGACWTIVDGRSVRPERVALGSVPLTL